MNGPQRRQYSGLDHDPWEPIESIRVLLADVYKYGDGGRTILRELVQNADDARARELVFAVVREGFGGADNSLLCGPALVVVNDGPFPGRDHDGLHRAIGGAKRGDASKVGRFGLGLKSVFHLGEAFLYVGRDAGDDQDRVGALNPWAGTASEPTGAGLRGDPLHPDWDFVSDSDYARLRALGLRCLPGFERQGLLLWIPLRRQHADPRLNHVNRGADSGHEYGISERRLEPEQLISWFQDADAIRLLLAQAGSLRGICALELARAEQNDPIPLGEVRRQHFESCSWVDRPRREAPRPEPERGLEGTIVVGSSEWRVIGRDVHDDRPVDRLREEAGRDWPRDWERDENGRSREKDRKAVGHAAVTVVRRERSAPRAIHIRWSVFFPLDDAPAPQPNSPIVDTQPGTRDSDAAWDVLLHAYFWPAQDRRSIPGVTDLDEAPEGGGDLRFRLNRLLRDELLLPLLPAALRDACAGVPEDWTEQLVRAVARTRLWADHTRSNLSRNSVLVPIIESDRLSWSTVSQASTLIGLRGWSRAPKGVRSKLASAFAARFPDLTLISSQHARLGGTPRDWAAEHVAAMLELVDADELREGTAQGWLVEALRPDDGPVLQEPVASALADWLGRTLGEHALHKESREAWRPIFELLPPAWLIFVPKGASAAVVELGADGLIGAGMVPVPLGRPTGPQAHRPLAPLTRDRVFRGLRALGERLSLPAQAERATTARLQLAGSLLTRLGELELAEELLALPLLRALRFPETKREPWSVLRAHQAIREQRVFEPEEDEGEGAEEGREVDDNTESAETTLASRRAAVRALASALGEPAWLVERGVVRSPKPPPVTPLTLANALLTGHRPLASSEGRRLLLQRLAEAEPMEPEILISVRALLTGLRKLDSGELYYVETNDRHRDALLGASACLLGLLGRPWALVEPSLVEPLPHRTVQKALVHRCDPGTLHRLLEQALELEPRVWSHIEDADARRLLETLYPGPNDEGARARWARMPLHRTQAGGRVALERCRRPVPGVRLPTELATSVHLLEPDPGLEVLYKDVPELGREEALCIILRAAEPHRFPGEIIALLSEHGRPRLPKEQKLGDLVRGTRWLPVTGSGAREAIALDDLLLLPDAVAAEVRPLVQARRLGEVRLVEDVDGGAREEARALASGLARNASASRQIRELALLMKSHIGYLGDYPLAPSELPHSVLTDALRTSLVREDAGWRLWASAADCSNAQEGNAPDESALELGKALVGPLSEQRKVELLEALARSTPAKETPAGRVYTALFHAFSPLQPESFERLTVPTQDGRWHAATTVARSASGVATKHLLRLDLRDALRLGEVPAPQLADAALAGSSPSAQDARLREYFKTWRGRVPDDAVGAFLAVLGDWPQGGGVTRLAQEWLGEKIRVQNLRSQLLSSWPPKSLPPPYVYHPFSGERYVDGLNLAGRRFKAEVDDGGSPSVFAVEPSLGTYRGNERCWELTLRLPPEGATSAELLYRLQQAFDWWCSEVLQIDQTKVRTFWRRYGTGSQAAIGPVRAQILASLPLTLRELNVHSNPPLAGLLKVAEHATRDRVQASGPQVDLAVRAERKALDELADALASSQQHHAFVLKQVRAKMKSFGYSPSSTLLELAQNADDALAQAAEMFRGPTPEATRTLIIKLMDLPSPTDRTITRAIDVVHYGRPINETGGPSFPQGTDRQWELDLYFMMLMNLSAKPGDDAGQEKSTATTGRFGLGFKSVHLLSDAPTVVSGFLSFAIKAGLLPEEVARDGDPSLDAVQGRWPTRVRMPLRAELEPNNLIEVFERFDLARPIIPAFARQLRRIVVDGGPRPGCSEFVPQPLVAGWSVGRDPVNLGDARTWSLLRLSLRDAGQPHSAAALLLGVAGGRVEPLPGAIPFLWNTLPTGEAWNVGYAVNGPVKLDPGRSHVALEDEGTQAVFRDLGFSLGSGLLALHDALEDGRGLQLLGLQPSHVHAFRRSLWVTLARGLSSEDPKRAKLLRAIHAPGRGLHCWALERSAVPSLLPAPFAAFLPPLILDKSYMIAGAELSNESLCAALAEVEDIPALLTRRRVVSQETGDVLRVLLDEAPSRLTLEHILLELAEAWDCSLTRSRLASLEALLGEDLRDVLYSKAQGLTRELQAPSRAGTMVPINELMLCIADEPSNEDEKLRSEFAPPDRVLADELAESTSLRVTYRRLRGKLVANAEILASWIRIASPGQRIPAVRYLSYGELASGVRNLLKSVEQRPDWLRRIDDVSKVLQDADVEEAKAKGLLAELFPDAFPYGFSPVPTTREVLQPVPREVAQKLIRDLWDEWADPGERERKLAAWRDGWYPRDWPDQRLRAALSQDPMVSDEAQTAWMILFTLGTVQGLGRTKPEQHRGFVEELMWRQLEHRSWWAHLFARFPDEANASSWFRLLEGWANARGGHRLRYDHWFTMLPELFAAWRWLPDYRRLTLESSRRHEGPLHLLYRPRVDPEQSFGGSEAPPLPLIRQHWLISELLRLEIVPKTEVLRAEAWTMSRRLQENLRLLGFTWSEGFPVLSAQVVRFLAEMLGPERDPTFFDCFDRPLVSDEFTSRLEGICKEQGLPTPERSAWDDLGGGWLDDVQIAGEEDR